MGMRRLLITIFLVSVSAISYEILLMRLLSIIQWHHFAWMIISLALLGYGASGVAVALGRRYVEQRFEAMLALAALLFSVSMILCTQLGQRIPFNALEVIWDPWQFLYLAELYLLFMGPFFFAACCIGLALSLRKDWVERIYFSDLLGAGLGAALVIGLLFLLPPQRAVISLALLPLTASVLALGKESRLRHKGLTLLQLAWLGALAYALPQDRIGLHISEFKGLSQALEVVESRVLAERSGPLGLLTVVESPRVPFRHAPGLSFTTKFIPSDQLAVFTDAEGLSAITAFDGDFGTFGYLGDVTAALPYVLMKRPRVLVVGAGAGSDVLLALYNGARAVDAVELNPQMVALLRGEFAEYSGFLYEDKRVSLEIGEARGFVSRHDQAYDLLQLALLESSGGSGSGVRALGESYLYTTEAMIQWLSHLEPGGLLSVTCWLQVPPRDSLKLAGTLIAAMRESGVVDPGRRLIVIRNWSTVTLLAKNGDFTADEISRARQFARQRSFDMAWYPLMPAEEANRFNRLDRAWIHKGVSALLDSRASSFISGYKFNIRPATDDRPYFFNFFKWSALPELMDLRKRGGAGLVEWGYLVLVATLAQAVLAGAILILLPLVFARRDWPPNVGGGMGSYCFLLGIAFLFVEMAFIQKFILFLAHPLYAVAVVLAGFLVFAGLGSAWSRRFAARLGNRAERAVLAAVAGIAGIVVLYQWLLTPAFLLLIGLNDGMRVLISLALIAPLAFCMGMPFPLGLVWLAREAPAYIPWAWGLNGFASVISAALAMLLAIEFGFSTVLWLALLFYLLAAIVFTHSASSFVRTPSSQK